MVSRPDGVNMREKDRTIEYGGRGEQEDEGGGLRFLNWGKFGTALGHNAVWWSKKTHGHTPTKEGVRG